MDEMEALMLMPPKTVDLVWTKGDGDEYVARCSKAWLVLWDTDHRIGELMDMGFDTRTAHGADGKPFHRVSWNALHARDAYLDDLALLEEVHAQAIGFAKRQQRDLEEHTYQWVREAASGKVAAAIERERKEAAARNLLADFGGLLKVGERDFVAELVRTRNTYNVETRMIGRIAARVQDKIKAFFEKRAAPVAWHEETIIEAVKYLSGLDVDRAQSPNDQGWSGSDTKWGHWALSQIHGPQHDLAIRVGCVLCAGYLNTQLRGWAA